jgi:hypothetical protein
VLSTEVLSKILEKMPRTNEEVLQSVLKYLPTYATSADPTDLTPAQLNYLGFRRQDIIQFHLKCYTNRNYLAFHKAYLFSWWKLLGQSLNNIRVASAIQIPGDAKDLLHTYVLREPIYLPSINRGPNFVFDTPGLFNLPLFQTDLIVLNE